MVQLLASVTGGVVHGQVLKKAGLPNLGNRLASTRGGTGTLAGDDMTLFSDSIDGERIDELKREREITTKNEENT
jgi:hypothetical protein